MSNKESHIQIRIETDLKDKLKVIAKANNLNLSNYLRNSVEQIVNREDVLNAISNGNNAEQEELALFLENDEINDIGKTAKDEIISHCKECKPKTRLIKFTRKSSKFQSSFDVLKFGRGMLKCGEILYLAVNSSSFYDTAFLRCLEFAYSINIKQIEVIALTRSEYETITRSVLIADKVISKALEYHISLKGIDIMMLRIACVMYQNAQIRRMNTIFSLKTWLFWVFLHSNEETAMLYYERRKAEGYKKFKSRPFELYKREYKALYELNNLDRDKFRFALKYLIMNR